MWIHRTPQVAWWFGHDFILGVFCGIYLQGIKVFHFFFAPLSGVGKPSRSLGAVKGGTPGNGWRFFLWEKLHPKSNGWTLKMIVLNRILVVVYTCCGCELNFTLSFFLSFFIFIVSLWVYLKKIGRLDFFSGKHLGHESLRAKPTLATWEFIWIYGGISLKKTGDSAAVTWFDPQTLERSRENSHWKVHVFTHHPKKVTNSQNCQAFFFFFHFLKTPFLPAKTCIFRDKLITNPRSLTTTSLKSWWVFPDFLQKRVVKLQVGTGYLGTKSPNLFPMLFGGLLRSASWHVGVGNSISELRPGW